MPKMNRIIVTAAGTGGHIYPLIAMISWLKKSAKKNKKNVEFIFIGSRENFERPIFDKLEIKQYYLNLSGLNRKNPIKMFKFIVKNKISENEIKKILIENKPKLIIGAGGYMTYPVVKVANKLNIKSFIHEQNHFPGLANKMSEKYATKVFLGFKEAEKYFKDKNKLVYSGNPIRPKKTNKSYAKEKRTSELRILSFGGSLGSRRINEVMLSAFEKLEKKYKVSLCLITGRNDYENILKLVNTLTLKNKNNLRVLSFSDEIYDLYEWSDIVVLRSGAISVEEIKLFNKPAIFVPFKKATENHQFYNANSLVKKNAAYMLLEKDFTVNNVLKLISDVTTNKSKLTEIRNNLKNIKTKNANEVIESYILSELE